MKEKARKTSQRGFPESRVSRKKRRSESSSIDKRDDAPVYLKASKRKCRTGFTTMSRDLHQTAVTSLCLPVIEDAKDPCHDLRLAFSSIDSPSGDMKGGTPALDTIFSPVFNLLKGLNEEASSSCCSSVEQLDSLDEKLEDADTGIDCDAASQNQEASKRDTDQANEPALPLTCVAHSEALAMSRIDDASIASHSSDYEVFGSQAAFDMGEICLEWSFGDENRDPAQAVESIEDGLLDSEGASLFLAIQQSKALDCSQKSNQADTMADEDINDFDPYLFIKQLPDLSEVVSPGRSPFLLPKQSRRSPPITLVLDLDETLVHSTLERCDNADFTFPVSFNSQEYTVYVRRRPHLQMFMEKVAQMFEIIVFTASQSIYAEQLLNILDPKKRLIRHRMFRDSCVYLNGNYMKDLSVLGRDLAKVAIIDNSPQAFGFQVDNGIPIESWFDDQSDSALAGLLPFLESLVGVDDVRPIIAKQFNLRQKFATVTSSLALGNEGDPLERCS